MGSHDGNRDLYPRVLAEAARIAVPGARFALLTHEVRLTQELLDADTRWPVESEHRLTLRGHHPRIWTLRRR